MPRSCHASHKNLTIKSCAWKSVASCVLQWSSCYIHRDFDGLSWRASCLAHGVDDSQSLEWYMLVLAQSAVVLCQCIYFVRSW
jgi:hypothetical protein